MIIIGRKREKDSLMQIYTKCIKIDTFMMKKMPIHSKNTIVK